MMFGFGLVYAKDGKNPAGTGWPSSPHSLQPVHPQSIHIPTAEKQMKKSVKIKLFK
jgi:hypothetical protein